MAAETVMAEEEEEMGDIFLTYGNNMVKCVMAGVKRATSIYGSNRDAYGSLRNGSNMHMVH